MADDKQLVAQILQADARRRDALLAGDAAELARWVADDFLQVHANGVPEAKPSLLAKIERKGVVYKSVEVRSSEVAMLAPEIGLQHSELMQSLVIAGIAKPVHVRVISVWVLREERWQLRSYQGTLVAPPQ